MKLVKRGVRQWFLFIHWFAALQRNGAEARKKMIKMCLHAACEEILCFTSPSSSCARVKQHIHTWLEGRSQITAAYLKCENSASQLQIFLDKASAFLRLPKEVTQTVQIDCCTYLTFGHKKIILSLKIPIVATLYSNLSPTVAKVKW